MNIGKLLSALALGAVASAAQAKDCPELKSEIEARLQARGVQGHSLEIVAAADAGAGRVVGSCDGGANRIVYSRGRPGSEGGGGDGTGGEGAAASAAPRPAAPATPAAPKKRKKTTAPPPAIGNY